MKRIAFLLTCFAGCCGTLPGATFTVLNPNDSGAGSLRQALPDANSARGANVIAFNLPVDARSISPSSALPDVTNTFTLDDATQPGGSGAPLVEMVGTSAGSGTDGWRLLANGGVVRSLGSTSKRQS